MVLENRSFEQVIGNRGGRVAMIAAGGGPTPLLLGLGRRG
jgi:hypothetical protein